MSPHLLLTTLLPVFFVLVLGYWAGRHHRFNADQASGFNQLATTFAMPASIFVTMVALDRDLLLRQGPLLAVLAVVHLGLFGALLWGLRGRFGLSPSAVILLALMLASSSATVYGIAVLAPTAGQTSTGAIGLIALVSNIEVPIALFLLEKNRVVAPAQPGIAPTPKPTVGAAALTAATSPLLLAPVLGIGLVLARVPLPAAVLDSLRLLGQATTGVSVFAVGLTLAAQQISFSRLVAWGTLARLLVQPALLLGLLVLLHVHSDLSRGAVVATALPVGTLQALLASRYGALERELPSMLLFSTLAMVVSLPAWLALTAWLLP